MERVVEDVELSASQADRLFVAVKVLPLAPLLQCVVHLREQEPSGASIKWVEPVNWHVTLRFIGRVGGGDLPRIDACLQQALAGKRVFVTDVKGMSAFPCINKPQVLWAGFDDDGALEALNRDVNAALCHWGLPDRQGFNPHLTLARIKNVAMGRKVTRWVDCFATTPWGTVCVNEVVLYSSKLTTDGPIYTAKGYYQLV